MFDPISIGLGVTTPANAVAEAFRMALAAGEAFAGATAPNPPVGCVVLDARGAVLVCEAHRKAGSFHAEAAAIEACARAGVTDRIHTVVVTLEPCNHTGRTPPCTQAILATPAKVVWIGTADPNPKVRAGGAAYLAAKGLAVAYIDSLDHSEAAALSLAAQRLIAPFRRWSYDGRPWLTIKQAIAADGSMRPPTRRKTFTSASSLILAHRLRRRADAIITGSGCILADDPDFTVRHVEDHPGKRRTLAILDRRGRTSREYLDAAAARGFDVEIHSDIPALLARLTQTGVIEALVEAGPTVHAAFIDQDLWDEQVIIRQGPTPDQPDVVDVRTRRLI